MKKLLSIFIICAVMLTSLGFAPKQKNSGGEYFTGKDILRIYRSVDNVKQILLVQHEEGSHATAKFYVKSGKFIRTWSQVFECEALLGYNGVGKEKEGDGKTPLGDFGVREAFGIEENPGTSLPYVDITPTTVCCSEDCEFYNQIVDTAVTGHYCNGTPMYLSKPDFNYGIFLNYNSENIYPKGSGIFIHCIGKDDYTQGCISVPEENMITILQNADSNFRTVIFE